MQNETASQTALSTAYLRAAHQLLDTPLMLDDPVALPLLGPQAAKTIRRRLDRYQSAHGKVLRSHVCLRARFTEDALREAVAHGVGRYVLVGAGFDSFALRQPDWAKSLAIVEIDHPATQTAKRALIADAGFDVPENLTFVPVDFRHETLADLLVRIGVGQEEKVFFSWLGVAMYLEAEAIAQTLKAMSAFAFGSEVVMTFKPPLKDADAHRLADRVATLGEPFVSFATPAEMKALLCRCGFSAVTFLAPPDARRRYFTSPRCDLPVPLQTNIVRAQV